MMSRQTTFVLQSRHTLSEIAHHWNALDAILTLTTRERQLDTTSLLAHAHIGNLLKDLKHIVIRTKHRMNNSFQNKTACFVLFGHPSAKMVRLANEIAVRWSDDQ